jgi:dipeptidyl aminopeptidase/acylaminoacyl peptidase
MNRLLMGMVSLGALATAGFANAAPADPAPFTIEQVLDAPYPTSLAAAPKGGAAAWVFSIKGVRNVWIGETGATTKSRQITAFTKDDGNDIGDVAWSPDGSMIAFTRGQTLEDDAPANVASSPDGPTSREIWVVSAAGGEARKVGNGHEPSFSPDGKQVVYLDKRQVLTVDLAGAGAKPRPLLTDFGAVRGLTWSPDGHRFAFVSQRRLHALIGVFDTTARTLTWAAPSFDIDSSPTFSPDGKQLAFIRVLVAKASPFISRRAGLPWQIWTADAATGLGKRVWTADAGPGSVYRPTLAAENLLWAADGQLVFPWEKSGWMQPWAVPATGGTAHALASGAFEVPYMTLDPSRRKLVFASNQNDIDRLHFWTSDLSSKPPVPVAAPGTTIEAFPQISADGSIFALQSSGVQQLSPAVLRGGKWQRLAAETTSASFPTAHLAAPQSVIFKARDGLDVHGQLFLPPAGMKGPHPTVLFFHGGPPRQMLAGFHYMGFYAGAYGFNEYLASKGYVVLSVNYRGGIGYGMEYREAKDFGLGGGSETQDLLGAITWLQGRADVDRKRIGVWGGSYGGLMTALALARASDSIAVGVDYAGVYNWSSMLATMGAPIDDPEDNKRAIASSPVATIGQWRSPVLVIQADDDRNVPATQSTELIQDLRAHGVEHETLIIPNEVHDLTRYASWLILFHATDDYLGRYLQPAPRATK